MRYVGWALLAGLLLAGCGGRGNETDPAAQAAVGKELYTRNGCAVCHGDQGRGDGRMAPTLQPPPRDFTDSTAYSRGAGIEQIKASIRNGTGAMPAYPHLKSGDIHLIALYIRSLQKP